MNRREYWVDSLDLASIYLSLGFCLNTFHPPSTSLWMIISPNYYLTTLVIDLFLCLSAHIMGNYYSTMDQSLHFMTW